MPATEDIAADLDRSGSLSVSVLISVAVSGELFKVSKTRTISPGCISIDKQDVECTKKAQSVYYTLYTFCRLHYVQILLLGKQYL